VEYNDVYKLCNFANRGDCFNWIGQQPLGNNLAVKIPACNKCPDDPLAGAIFGDPKTGFACGSYLGVDGSAPWVRPPAGTPDQPKPTDGILIHTTINGGISLTKVTDGASHTLIMGERGVSDMFYGWPYCGLGDMTQQNGDGDMLLSTRSGLSAGLPDGKHDYHFWSYHPNLAQFICADGAGHALSYDIDLRTFQALSTRAGGEVVQLPPEW
jgi:hypothetical protein